ALKPKGYFLSAQQDLVIGVDSSTTACKAIAWDRHGKLVAEGRATYELLTPAPSWYEQRAEDWWSGLCKALRAVSRQVGSRAVAGVGLAIQRETFVPVDEHGQAMRNAILWVDERSRGQVHELDRRIGNDKLHDLTGKGPSTKQSLPKLLWLQENEPEV